MAQHFLRGNRPAGAERDFQESSTRLIAMGIVGVVVLSLAFAGGTVHAITTIDNGSIAAERERAGLALDAALRRGETLDAESLEALGRDYALANAHLVTDAHFAGNEVAIALPGGAGDLAWTPRQPATEVLVSVGPLRITAALLILTGILLVLRRLHGLARDIDRRRAAARQQATRDALTGLLNRRGFAEALDAAFASGEDIAVLYLDLDGFKKVNDRLGHAAGDQLLTCVGQRLLNAVGPHDSVARLGGDEFVVLRRQGGTQRQLAELAARIHARLGLPYGLDGAEAEIGLSIGIASRTADTASAADLVKSADAALYRAKDVEGVPFAFAEPLAEGLPKAA